MYGKPGYRVTSTLHQQRTNAKEVLGLARKWLDTCLNEHEACRARASSSKNFIPTRLIEITPINESIMSLRLVHGQDLPPETQYLTLSHCWGRAKFTTLTPDTLAPFQKEIPFFQLPKNFRDATTATSLLGYKHIWIDSLCIIQGCEEDWEQEAARMGSVYRHSVCTIAALGSDNGHGGCFMTRSHKAFVPCQLVPQSKEKSGVYADLWRPTNSLQPLHDRAWVVQERCLSIRTLNFGKEMVSWDCICAKASELEPDMQDTSYEGGLKRTFNDLLSKSKSTPPAASDQRRWSDKWWKLVSAYSSCNLTYAKDKWPAISGLATEVE
ncbi:heterokaryon incompatibility protein-domain-containing protein, partial [Lophiotrema nucula]